MEGSETEMDTARREISEETGLQPAFLSGFCHREEYHLSEKPGTWKRVTYFLAEFENQSLVAQESEIRNILLLPYEQAYSLFPYENTRQVLAAAHAHRIRHHQTRNRSSKAKQKKNAYRFRVRELMRL